MYCGLLTLVSFTGTGHRPPEADRNGGRLANRSVGQWSDLFSTILGSIDLTAYNAIQALIKISSIMRPSDQLIPSNEREALQWLIPALDRLLNDMPHEEFLKAWFAIGYLYGGLNPDEAADHGTEISIQDNGPDRFRLIEPRLIAPYYVKSGWPVVLAPMVAEAWARNERGQMDDDELYCHEIVRIGILDRIGGNTGLVSTPLKS